LVITAILKTSGLLQKNRVIVSSMSRAELFKAGMLAMGLVAATAVRLVAGADVLDPASESLLLVGLSGDTPGVHR